MKKSSQRTDHSLQFIEETSRLSPIHLSVVELEGDLESRPEEAAFVASPNEERIVEDAAIHADCAVDVVLRQSRRADDHRVGQVMVLAALCHLPCEPQVLVVEERQVVAEGDVARTDLAFLVFHDSTHGEAVEPHQPAAFGQQIELLDAARSLADAPAHQHVELHSRPPARSDKPRHVERLEQRHHWHRRLHPHLEGIGAARLFGVDFLFHRLICALFQCAKVRNS